MGMGFAPNWLRQVSPPPMLHMTTLTTAPVSAHSHELSLLYPADMFKVSSAIFRPCTMHIFAVIAFIMPTGLSIDAV